jgi:hypothetical protein
MIKTRKRVIGLSAVDDVRLVREKIARRHAGDMREHVKESRRITKDLRKKLGLKLVSSPAKRRHGTGG